MCSWCAATGGPSLLRRPGRGAPRASSMWCPSPLIGRAPAALQRPQPRSSPSRPGPSVHGCLPLPSCSPPTGAPIAATSERQAPGCLLPEAVCKTRTLLGQQMNVKDDSTSFSARPTRARAPAPCGRRWQSCSSSSSLHVRSPAYKAHTPTCQTGPLHHPATRADHGRCRGREGRQPCSDARQRRQVGAERAAAGAARLRRRGRCQQGQLRPVRGHLLLQRRHLALQLSIGRQVSGARLPVRGESSQDQRMSAGEPQSRASPLQACSTGNGTHD